MTPSAFVLASRQADLEYVHSYEKPNGMTMTEGGRERVVKVGARRQGQFLVQLRTSKPR